MPPSPSRAKSKRSEYKIGEACKALDIQPYVLRYWETEFAALSPNKSRSGQRVYGDRELDIIRRIKQLLYDEGYTIAGAKKRLEAELESGQLEAGDPKEEPSPKPAKAVKQAAPAPVAESETQLDSQAAKKIEHLRQGVERALRQTQEILNLLDSNPS